MRELLCLFVGISIFEVDLISSELMTATSELSEKEKRVLERVSDILEQTGEGMGLTEFQVVIKIISIVIVSNRIAIIFFIIFTILIFILVILLTLIRARILMLFVTRQHLPPLPRLVQTWENGQKSAGLFFPHHSYSLFRCARICQPSPKVISVFRLPQQCHKTLSTFSAISTLSAKSTL